MGEYKKKAIVITQEGKPVLLCEIKEFTAEEFVRTGKECEINKKLLKQIKNEKEKVLLGRISELEKQVKILKGED